MFFEITEWGVILIGETKEVISNALEDKGTYYYINQC